jgi:hypothetical protein
MTTERADFRFTVKEGDDGKPRIGFEPSGRQLTNTKGSFGFDLKATTLESAHEVAKYPNLHIRALTVTVDQANARRRKIPSDESQSDCQQTLRRCRAPITDCWRLKAP